jgi:hypothetical protein
MITRRVWFIVLATSLVFSLGVWTSFATAAHANHADASPPIPSRASASLSATGHAASPAVDSEALQQLLKSAAPHLDVYGNEIEDAMTDYRIDPAGDIYERHSPETEVARLGPPVS